MDGTGRILTLRPEGVLPPGIAAGWTALTRGEWAQARDRFTLALGEGDSAEAWEGLAWAAWWLDDVPLIFEARERAYRLYRERGDHRGAARTAAWLALDYVDYRHETAVAAGWMQRAHRLLARCPLCPEHAWLAAFDAHHALMADKDPRTAQALAEQAASIAETLGAVDAEMMGRALEGLALVSQGHVREGMRLLDEATTAVVAGEVTDLQAVGLTCCYMIYACERVWDYQRAAQWCDRVTEFCRRWHFTMLWAVCRTQYAGILIWQGAWAEAEAELAAAARDLASLRPALAGSAITRLGELRRRQGRWEEAAQLFRQVEASTGALLGRAELALDQEEPATAVDLAQRYLRRFAPESRTEEAPALDILVRAWVALGDLTRAQETLARLQAVADTVGSEILHAVARGAAGCVALAAGQLDHARTSWEDAVDLFARCGAPFELARARLELARTLMACGRPSAASEEARRARQGFLDLGAEREAARAARVLAQLEAGTAVPPPAGELSRLTPREMDVLRLIARGMSDREIAEELTISEHTVHRHVSNILTKLGFSSRAAAAAAAGRHGLV